jgi:hypothetical protein
VAFTKPGRGTGRQAGDTTVYGEPDDAFTTATQVLDDGVRSLVVIDEAAAPTAYDYEFSGAVADLALDEDGGVVLFNAAGDGVGHVAAPWARDVNGREIPTWFVIDGTTLTQIVDHRLDDIEYPVIADPTVSRQWWGNRIRFNRSETLRIASGAAGCAGVLGLVPTIPTKVVSGSCTVIAAYAFNLRAWGKCLQLNLHWSGTHNLWGWGC